MVSVLTPRKFVFILAWCNEKQITNSDGKHDGGTTGHKPAQVLCRIVLITIVINSLMLSLCNIYVPNNLGEQLEFLQELNNCLIDKSELTTLIVGGDWNCTLSKNDKSGGKPWKATNYRSLVLTTIDVLDLVDIQRERHPKLCKYSYESKALK